MTLGSRLSSALLRVASAVVFALAPTLGFAAGAHAGVVHVDDDAPADGDGVTWATAYRFLQDGLDYAANPDNGVKEIRIGAGTYLPDRSEAVPGGTADRTVSFLMIDDVVIVGGYAGFGAGDPDEHDPASHPSVLSGDLLVDDDGGANRGDNSHHVVQSIGLPPTAVLDSVTISSGNSDGAGQDNGAGLRFSQSFATIVDCLFEDNTTGTPNGSGAAAQVVGGHPTFERCEFTGNAAGTDADNASGGGAVRVNAEATFTDCSFTNNTAGLGGAILVSGNTTLIGCSFEGNTAVFGGAIHVRKVSSIPNRLIVLDCLVQGNTADNAGGGIRFASADPAPMVANTRFLDNHAIENTGGALSRLVDGASVACCLFAGNTAPRGGAVMTQSRDLSFINCTFTANEAELIGGGLYQIDNNPPTITNAIFWANSVSGNMGETGQLDRATHGYDPPIVNYSDIMGLTGEFGGIGNVDVDPTFEDADGPDDDPLTFDDNAYELANTSPCIDAGHNWGVPEDVMDLDGDGDTTECTPLEISGNPRFADTGVGDTGCGLPAVVDMGAFEHLGKSVNPVRLADLDGDATVAFSDVLILLASWGADPEGDACIADVNLDLAVDFEDLLLMLSFWS